MWIFNGFHEEGSFHVLLKNNIFINHDLENKIKTSKFTALRRDNWAKWFPFERTKPLKFNRTRIISKQKRTEQDDSLEWGLLHSITESYEAGSFRTTKFHGFFIPSHKSSIEHADQSIIPFLSEQQPKRRKQKTRRHHRSRFFSLFPDLSLRGRCSFFVNIYHNYDSVSLWEYKFIQFRMNAQNLTEIEFQ